MRSTEYPSNDYIRLRAMEFCCHAVAVRRLLLSVSRQCRRWRLRRLVVSAAGLSRPAGGICRVARPLARHEKPHRRPAVARLARLGALPPPASLLHAGARTGLHYAAAPTVSRRPPDAATSVLSRRVT